MSRKTMTIVRKYRENNKICPAQDFKRKCKDRERHDLKNLMLALLLGYNLTTLSCEMSTEIS